MIKIKYENLEQAKRSISQVNEYETFDRYVKYLNGGYFFILATMIFFKVSMVIAFIVFFLFIILTLLRVQERIVVKFYKCPCEIKSFRKNLKVIIRDKEIMSLYEKVALIAEDFPYGVVLKRKKKIEVADSSDRLCVVELPKGWKFHSTKGTIYTIDFDSKEVY